MRSHPPKKRPRLGPELREESRKKGGGEEASRLTRSTELKIENTHTHTRRHTYTSALTPGREEP